MERNDQYSSILLPLNLGNFELFNDTVSARVLIAGSVKTTGERARVRPTPSVSGGELSGSLLGAAVCIGWGAVVVNSASFLGLVNSASFLGCGWRCLLRPREPLLEASLSGEGSRSLLLLGPLCLAVLVLLDLDRRLTRRLNSLDPLDLERPDDQLLDDSVLSSLPVSSLSLCRRRVDNLSAFRLDLDRWAFSVSDESVLVSRSVSGVR